MKLELSESTLKELNENHDRLQRDLFIKIQERDRLTSEIEDMTDCRDAINTVLRFCLTPLTRGQIEDLSDSVVKEEAP